jgi:hypothetical protein
MKHLSLPLALALLLATLAAPRPARADDADTGVAIASGLAIAVVAVYALVGLQSDVERYSEAAPTRSPDLDAVIARAAATADRVPLALVPVTASPDPLSPSTPIPGAALALRTTF